MREVQKQRRSHISYAKPTRRESHSQSGNTCSPRWSIILIMPRLPSPSGLLHQMHWARCERDTRWKFAIRPTRKQLRAADDPFIWDAAMKCAWAQLSGPLSNLDTILSLSPYYPKLRALAFSHRPNQYREETCLSSTISIERDKLLMLGCTTIIGICDCESYSYEPSRRSNQDNGENFACSTTVTRSVGGLVHFSASKKALSHASSNPLRSTFMHAACSEGNEDSLRERGAMQRCNFERAPYRHVCKIGWESKNSE